MADVEDGACRDCNINGATSMGSAIEGSNDICVCETCGKFLVASKKRKKYLNHPLQLEHLFGALK